MPAFSEFVGSTNAANIADNDSLLNRIVNAHVDSALEKFRSSEDCINAAKLASCSCIDISIATSIRLLHMHSANRTVVMPGPKKEKTLQPQPARSQQKQAAKPSALRKEKTVAFAASAAPAATSSAASGTLRTDFKEEIKKARHSYNDELGACRFGARCRCYKFHFCGNCGLDTCTMYAAACTE